MANESLKFNSVEEFERFVKAIKQDDEVYSIINWWAPFSGWGMTGLACWRNVAFDYVYQFVNNKAQFVSCSNSNSYLSGINVTFYLR